MIFLQHCISSEPPPRLQTSSLKITPQYLPYHESHWARRIRAVTSLRQHSLNTGAPSHLINANKGGGVKGKPTDQNETPSNYAH